MAASRGRGLRPGGVVRALGRLVLLVAVGFGAGLVIGVLSEEPELLADHLRGESESVALADAATSGEESAPSEQQAAPLARPGAPGDDLRAAVAPAGGGERDGTRDVRSLIKKGSPDDVQSVGLPAVAAPGNPSPRPAETLAAQRVPLASLSPRRPESWAIQVGAFSDRIAAVRLAEGLDEKGYPVEIVPANGKQRRWRVRVQPLSGEADAKAMADRLKREERLPTWVLPMEARSQS